MANYAAFVQLAGESLNGIVNLSIHRYYDSDSDTNAAFAPLIGPVSGPASYESPLLGFEGHGEDCFYAFIRIQSNDNSIQDAQTQGYCPQ
jgi:hypothetical protein